MATKLLDLSHHNDWPTTSTLRALSGIIFRCAYGLGTADRKFAEFVAQAKATGLPWAAYHFIKPGSGVDQAEFAMRRLDAVGGCAVLFMDREWENGVIASERTADDYVNRVDRAGLTTGTYMSLSIYRSHGAKIDWVAKWGGAAPSIWHAGDFWQYAGDNTPPGNRLDRDYFNGSPAELRSLFANGRLTSPVPHTPPVEPVPPILMPGEGDVMFNLTPGVAKRVVVLRPGTIFYDHAKNGTRYSAVSKDAPPDKRDFPLLGGAGGRLVVANGDYATFVDRKQVEQTLVEDRPYGV